MKALQATSAAALVAVAAFVSTAWAQGPADIGMVAPEELKWADFPALPPGAKIAVIQGPTNEAKPYTIRLKFPANYRVPAHTHPV